MNEKIEFPANESEENSKGTYNISKLENPTEEEIQEIISLDNEIFPPEMWVDASELKETLESAGVQTVLKGEGGKIVGYIISLPHNQAYPNLIELDPELKQEEQALYIESMGIIPKHRSLKNFLTLLHGFNDQARQVGFQKITGHFRVSQGLSSVLEKRFGGKKFRRIEDWAGFGEPFDYIEINLNNNENI